MNSLQRWVKLSRYYQSRAPERYLISYPELRVDDKNVRMTQDTLTRIEKACGRYDGTFPTGEFLGKMFLRGEHLCWFGIDKKNPMTRITLKSRKIVLVDE